MSNNRNFLKDKNDWGRYGGVIGVTLSSGLSRSGDGEKVKETVVHKGGGPSFGSQGPGFESQIHHLLFFFGRHFSTSSPRPSEAESAFWWLRQ